MSEWFVYILRCADDTLYTGITNDVPRRLEQHNAGTASRYTTAASWLNWPTRNRKQLEVWH